MRSLYLLFCFWQPFNDPVRPSEMQRLIGEARAVEVEQNRVADAVHKRREFERKFNELVTAVHNFSEDYNSSAGNVWPKKKADALQKAIRALQSAERWNNSPNR